jgi:hypothetical protein
LLNRFDRAGAAGAAAARAIALRIRG